MKYRIQILKFNQIYTEHWNEDIALNLENNPRLFIDTCMEVYEIGKILNPVAYIGVYPKYAAIPYRYFKDYPILSNIIRKLKYEI